MSADVVDLTELQPMHTAVHDGGQRAEVECLDSDPDVIDLSDLAAPVPTTTATQSQAAVPDAQGASQQQLELKRALEEKEELRRKLEELTRKQRQEEEQRQQQQPGGALKLVELPDHWEPMEEGELLRFVRLPLGRSSGAAAHGARNAASSVAGAAEEYSQEAIDELVQQGLPEADARAALQHCKGDVEDALMWAVECMDNGGAAAVKIRSRKGRSEASRRSAAREEQERRKEQARQQQAALEAEAERVLARFEDDNGIPRSRVKGIERVQNPLLWTKYCLTKHEVQLAGGQANEHTVFHGADRNTLAIITKTGFDIRVAGLGGSHGAGTYFAHSSSYSEGYSATAPHAATSMSNPYYGMAAAIAYGGIAVPPGLKRKPGATKRLRAGVPPPLPEPHYPAGKLSMLMCRAALGRVTLGVAGLRRPPDGFDSVCYNYTKPMVYRGNCFVLFNNSQAFPEYIVHFT